MPWPHLPKRVHYALKALACLAGAQTPLRASELAECSEIPPAQAAKILYLLTWGGFVRSRRGSKGGFWLRVPPHRIRVQEVMEFFHPPVDDRGEESSDPILRVWRETAASSHGAFERLTLADLLSEDKAPVAFRGLVNPENNWPFCP